jgi:dUTP pyrophosphatase
VSEQTADQRASGAATGAWTDPGVPGDLDVAVQRLDPELPLPAYAHPGDAGADLLTTVDVTIAPGERALVPTGIAIALPEGYAAFVQPRSGLAARHGLSVVNTPGTVDAGYRGEIKVMLINHDLREPIELRRGDRIAQLVVQRVERARFREVAGLPGSVRGAGGYGSTGGFGPPPPSPASPASPGVSPTEERS